MTRKVNLKALGGSSATMTTIGPQHRPLSPLYRPRRCLHRCRLACHLLSRKRQCVDLRRRPQWPCQLSSLPGLTASLCYRCDAASRQPQCPDCLLPRSQPNPVPRPLLSSQAADGAFNLDARLAIILGCDLRDLHGAMSCAATPLCDLGYVVSERAWATALVLVALDSTFAPLRESWSLFASRSTLWLSRTLRTCQARECPIGAPSATGSVPEAHQVVTSAGAGAARIMAALMLSARKTLGT